MSTIQLRGCEYHLLEQRIHYCIWHSSTCEAVDEYIEHTYRIYASLDTQRFRRWLHIDGGRGLPPFNYFLQKMRELESYFPDRLPNRSAVVYSPAVKPLLLKSVITLTTLPGKDIIRTFPLLRQAEAMLWLTEEMQLGHA